MILMHILGCTSPISTSVIYTENEVVITLTNQSDLDLYLFDSYLVDDLFTSPYIHLYDAGMQTMTLSFLPLLPYLGGMKPDLIRPGRNIVNRGFYTYHFTIIPKQGVVTLKIPNKALQCDDCMEYLPINHYSKFEPGIPFQPYKSQPTHEKTFIEMAVYSEIGILLDENAYATNEFAFDAQAKDYQIIRVQICSSQR